ncbi:CRIB domain-containing protein RIC7-like [Tripterygium wilfordii]|uniref:CRIB domain-containing protein RIC7-like n=1 Tax=Tripterygium wilfordii TaxID=458696 RepID=A0A7J7CS81_TRIWF|nr:CRIB domain-containing protein RIC7-like [Tripterygium wilfordii]
MGTKVKGLLKGFRYISQMFDEKEPEMQIGLPTDVKHVAHIGWEGPSANTPSWMNGFKSAPELSASEPLSLIGEAKSPFTNKLSLEDVHQIEQNGNKKPKHRSRRSTNTTGSALNSPTRRGSDAPKPSRRNHNSNFGSPSQDSSGSSRTSRRHQTSSLGLESPSHEQPTIPKQSRQKKSKGGSGGSSRSSRLKGQNPIETSSDAGSVSESMEGLKTNEDQLGSVLET